MRNFFATRPSPPPRTRRLAAPIVVGATIGSLLSGRAAAQVVPGAGSQIGSIAGDRARIEQLTGHPPDSTASHLIPSGFRSVYPTLRVVENSALPADGNDGALWAGRGLSASLSGGFSYARRVRAGNIVLWVEPELLYSANRPFPVIAGREPGRSAFSSPWHIGRMSADLPLRFGDQAVRAIGPGQSSITVTTDRVTFGAATSNEWWGPALRNTLLISDNAAGIPRLFARTTTPLRTKYGKLEGRAFIGGLSESPYFDEASSNDIRSLNGLLVTFQPALDTGLTIGLSRLVMATVPSPLGVLPHMLDVLLSYETMRDVTDTLVTGEFAQSSDQLISLFARWVFSESGVEIYGEWSRMELPRSIRQFLEVPQNTQGYTLGLQWVGARSVEHSVRLQSEVTYLEQTREVPGRATQDYYTGRATAQGFTQRGQILGASIGPGASSQFVGGDYLAPRWQAGAFVGRVRSENDALYREGGPRNTQHDVTLYSGVRGGVRLPRSDVAGTLSVGRRYNYLFQSNFYIGSPVRAVDIQNTTFTMSITPR